MSEMPAVTKVKMISGSEKKRTGIHTLENCFFQISSDSRAYVRPRGGTLRDFLGGYVPPGTPNCYPVLKKISHKIDTPFLKWANFLYPVLEFALKLIPRSRKFVN